MSEGEELVGGSVVLARLRDADSPILFSWINDRELVTQSAPFRDISRREHDAWFDSVRRADDVSIFGIRLKADDRLVGTCQLRDIHPIHGSAELRIRLGTADARGRGIGTEATMLLLRHAFRERRLHRVWLHVFAANEPAWRLYQRVGFRQEGVLREAARIDDAWIDVVVMAILRDDFGQ